MHSASLWTASWWPCFLLLFPLQILVCICKTSTRFQAGRNMYIYAFSSHINESVLKPPSVFQQPKAHILQAVGPSVSGPDSGPVYLQTVRPHLPLLCTTASLIGNSLTMSPGFTILKSASVMCGLLTKARQSLLSTVRIPFSYLVCHQKRCPSHKITEFQLHKWTSFLIEIFCSGS